MGKASQIEGINTTFLSLKIELETVLAEVSFGQCARRRNSACTQRMWTFAWMLMTG